MKLRRSIKDPHGESLLFRRRALAGFVLIVLCLCLLLSRFVFLQVMRHDEFVTRSQANRVKPRAIPPARGLIYDRSRARDFRQPQYRTLSASRSSRRIRGHWRCARPTRSSTAILHAASMQDSQMARVRACSA